MNVSIEVIPNEDQRYPTVGDWFFKPNGDLVIRVSELGDWRKEICVAIHELVEVSLCKHRGISQECVDRFDTDFESTRHPDNTAEPGDDPSAPYVAEHCLATGIERILASALALSWKDYEDKINSL